MKQVTKEEFYKILAQEKRDIVSSIPYVGKPFYPCTTEFKHRYGSNLFGKVISLGYVKGEYTQEFYLS